MRDYAIGATFDVKFTTRQFSTGTPYTLAGTPAVVAYPDNSTTEITAGITLTVDFDSRTGLNNVRIVATTGNGYVFGSTYHLVISAGTVDSVSVVGEVVGAFTLSLVPQNIMDFDMSQGTDSGSATVRTVRQALRALRNKFAVAAGVYTVYKENDSTTSWSSTVSSDASAEPIIGSDPSGP